MPSYLKLLVFWALLLGLYLYCSCSRAAGSLNLLSLGMARNLESVRRLAATTGVGVFGFFCLLAKLLPFSLHLPYYFGGNPHSRELRLRSSLWLFRLSCSCFSSVLAGTLLRPQRRAGAAPTPRLRSQIMWLRPNNSFKPKPLRGSA